MLTEELNEDLKLSLNKIKADFIIVGQGLAGSVLSLQLIDKGYKVVIIDDASSSCSRVAAGIWNPVVFKRLTKSWMADEVLPYMLEFYQAQEKKLGTKFITERSIIKLFTELQEANLWRKKAEEEMASYLDKEIFTGSLAEHFKVSEIGYAKVLRAGNLDLPVFINAVREFLQKNEMYLSEKFDHSSFSPSALKSKNIETENVIFCEGYLIRNNPFFNYVPMKPAKGEVLTMQFQNLNLNKDILNKNGFIMPLEDDKFKVGATYNWTDLSEWPTAQGKSELLDKLDKMTNAKGVVVNHEAGVRPSVIDRRPLLGAHPTWKNIYVFNGMGTKGVMLAPFFANHLIEHIIDGKNLNKEVSLARFNHFFVN